MKTSPLILLLALAMGCASTSNENVAMAVRLIAYNGTALALIDNPEMRGQFEVVHERLAVIEKSDQIELITVLGAARLLPIEQLKNPKARLVLDNLILMVSDFGDGVPPDQMEQLRPIVKAAREGVGLGLDLSPTAKPLSQPMLRKL